MSEEEKKQTIEAIFILEVIGRPKEHLVEALEELLRKMAEEKGVTIIQKDIKKPKEMEKRKDFFTTFAEIELKFDDLMTLTRIMFHYMPAHVEIVYPEFLEIQNNDLNSVINELSRRLHGYDEVARMMTMKKDMLEREIKELKEKKV